MDKFFQILAVILAGVAAFFLWQGNGDGAFISAALGAVSFFFAIRFQTKRRLNQYEEERLERLEREEYFAELESAGDFIEFDVEREAKEEIKIPRN